MNRSTVVLDARPLLQICHPRKWRDISDWFVEVIASRRRIVIPEIADYEVWRLLLKRGATRQLEELDGNVDDFYYAPLTTALMRAAAEVWADAENSGHRFGHPKTLNADVILVAQTQAMGADVTVILEELAHKALLDPKWTDLIDAVVERASLKSRRYDPITCTRSPRMLST